jgi:hypothetical protein
MIKLYNNEMGSTYSRTGDVGNAQKIEVEKYEGQRPLGKRRRKWGADNMKMHFNDMV